MVTKTRKRLSGSSNIKSYTEIKRLWGDVEVVDATQVLRVFVHPEDVEAATAKDPGACVFAQACRRQFQATNVLFLKSVAYVELPQPDGVRRAERFQMSPQMRDLVENFDRGKPVPGLAGFELLPPRPSYTLDAKLNRTRRSRTRSALVLGSSVQSRGRQGKGAYSKPPIVVDLEVRDGRGRVQFKRTPT